MNIGICKLCLIEKKLIRKSHVIPDFMYKGLFGEKHRLAQIEIQGAKRLSFVPTGYYNSNMICEDCDNRVLGRLETYANHVLYQDDNKRFEEVKVEHVRGDDGLKTILLNNIDYTRFKLFCVSILWRASISNHPFFRDVNLGVNYSEKARNMIYHNDAGEEDDFMYCIVAIKPSAPIPFKSIIEPIKISSDGNTAYYFFINGFFYMFNISKYNRLEMFDKGTITKENTMQIGVMEGDFANGFFDSYTKKPLRLSEKGFNDMLAKHLNDMIA